MTHLPVRMLIDMDDTILSAYGRPESPGTTSPRNSPPSSGR
jgi:hypothetical protein